jgi:glc operon protein GlcG
MRTWLGGLLMCAVMAGAELSPRKALNLEVAKQMAAAAEAEAIKNKWNVVIAIVDEGGHLIYLQRMDETQTASVEIAPAKAKAAVSFKRPTKAFEQAIADGRYGIVTVPGVLAAEGGVPVIVEGRVIGAVGVSGVQSAQDGIVAKAAVDSLMSALGK